MERPLPFGHRYPPAGLPTAISERAGRAITRGILRGFFRTEHVDRQHIPAQGAAILVSNHPTLGDPFMVAFGTRRWVSWLAFDEALEWPGAGPIMRLYRVIPLNLERPAPSSIKTAYATLARGRLLGVFCEGERSAGFGLNDPVKAGAARMALRAQVPIVPVTVSGARKVWPVGGYPKPGKIVVRYHPPIDAAGFRPELPHRERAELLTQELADTIGRALPPAGSPWFYPGSSSEDTPPRV